MVNNGALRIQSETDEFRNCINLQNVNNIISYLYEISETNGFYKEKISYIANDICNVFENSAQKEFGSTRNVQQLL